MRDGLHAPKRPRGGEWDGHTWNWFNSRHKSRKSSTVGSRGSSSDLDGQSSAITTHLPPRGCESDELPGAHVHRQMISARQWHLARRLSYCATANRRLVPGLLRNVEVLPRQSSDGNAVRVCQANADWAWTRGECTFILGPMMGVTRKAGDMCSGGWGQAERGRQAQRAFCTTLSLHEQSWRRKCQSDRNKGPAPTLSFHP